MNIALLGIKGEYANLSDLYFAVWDMIPPYNFVWVDFKGKRLQTGVKKVDEDPIAAINKSVGGGFSQTDEQDFVELISYDSEGLPVLNFDGPNRSEKGWINAKDICINALLKELQEMDILDWRCQYPSIREGICWRVDIYGSIYGSSDKGEEKIEKHLSGQARFPNDWQRFGKAIAAFVESCQN